MRLVFVCKSLPFTFKGGIQTHVWELTRHLVESGNEVTILTAGSWRDGLEVEQREGRTIVFLPYPPGRKVPMFRKTLEEACFNYEAYKWLKENAPNYDRIHIQGRSGCFYAANKYRKKCTPVVNTVHRLLEVEYEFDGQRTGVIDGFFHRFIMGIAERAAASRSEHVIAVSREVKRELKEAVGDKLAPISIIPNGVNRQFGDPLADKDRWQLVFVGRLESIKGLYTLIESVPKMDERIDLVLVGDGSEREALEARSIELGLRMRVFFVGEQDYQNVRFWIQSSFALVLPSFHESQGIVLLEAGACARPVIAAAVPGIDEMIEHGYNGLLVPAGDAGSLAVTVNHVFKNPKLATRLGRSGRYRASAYYDWARIAEQTIKLYRNTGTQHAGERTVPSAGIVREAIERLSLQS